MKYEEPRSPSRGDLVAAMDAGAAEAIVETLLGLVAHDPDWHWLQDTCLSLLTHDDALVRRNAVTALGHVARIHGTLDRARVEGALRDVVSTDPSLAGHVDDALDDIRMFA